MTFLNMISFEKFNKSIQFNASFAIGLLLFLTITTLHVGVDLLTIIHIESLSFIAILGIAILAFKNELFQNAAKASFSLFILFAFFAILPTLSSIFNETYFSIWQNEEYISLIKTFLVLPFVFFILSNLDKTRKNNLLNFYLFSLLVLGIIFFYRYLVLDEVREFDLRPLLKIRHGDPNFLCTIFAMGVPLALYKAVSNFKKKKLKSFLFHLFTSLFLIVSSLATQSRMGIMALALGCLYIFLKQEISLKKKIGFLLGGFILISLYFVVGRSDLTNRFTEINDKSNSDRILTYINGLTLVFNNPIWGTGMHTAKNFFYSNTSYPHFQSEFKQLDIHNTYLKAWAELGIFGIGLLVLFLYNIFKTIKINRNEFQIYLISSFLILIISSLTIGITYKDFFYIHLIFLAGINYDSNTITT